MIEVTIESVRVSLMSQQRIVVLKETDSDRYIPIWIGPFEADAITIELQGVEVPRPMTHDLLKAVITQLGATISHVVIAELENDTFYARIVLEYNGEEMEIDARSSDAIALAVRAKVPIYVAQAVMDRAAVVPQPDTQAPEARPASNKLEQEEEEELSVFRDFVEGLDLEGLGEP